jgi:hypothetical protein
MKIPKFAERYIVKLLLSKAGPYLQKAVTAAATAAVAYIASKLPGAENIVNPEVVLGLIWLALDAIVTQVATGPIKEYGKEIQETYNSVRPKNTEPIPVDGFVGPVTAEGIKEVAQK